MDVAGVLGVVANALGAATALYTLHDLNKKKRSA
jgi:hypothetical protein